MRRTLSPRVECLGLMLLALVLIGAGLGLRQPQNVGCRFPLKSQLRALKMSATSDRQIDSPAWPPGAILPPAGGRRRRLRRPLPP